MNYNKIYIFALVLWFPLFADSLFDAYLEAGPGDGYDKLVVLNPDVLYTGGVGIYEGNVSIEGNGAVIDLMGGNGIWVYGEGEISGSLDISHCTVINGGFYGINFAGISTGSVTNCNLINDGMGLQLMDTISIVIGNCNFVNNETYGLAIYSTNPTADISYCNAWNNGEDYMENCPG